MIALLAENDVSVRRLLARMLGGFCSLIEVQTYQEVRTVVERARLDIAAIDVMLDDGGIEECKDAIRKIREKMTGVVIVVWSGLVCGDKARDQLIEAGADGFLPKGGSFKVDDFYRLLLDSIESRAKRGDAGNALANIAIIEQCANFKRSNP